VKAALGLLTVELHLADSHSLKDRRRVVNSLKERLRQRFNVSVAEADFGDLWQRAGLIVSCAGSGAAIVEQTLRALLAFIEEDPRVLLMSPQLRFYE
jgi:uncharacterized protein YlxP (DUF503 family)